MRPMPAAAMWSAGLTGRSNDGSPGRPRALFLLGLPAVNALFAGLAGVPPGRALLLVALGGVFVAGFTLAPPPGRCPKQAPAGHPLLACALALAVATGATGGLSSPLL